MTRKLVIGQEVVHNERITTGRQGADANPVPRRLVGQRRPEFRSAHRRFRLRPGHRHGQNDADASKARCALSAASSASRTTRSRCISAPRRSACAAASSSPTCSQAARRKSSSSTARRLRVSGQSGCSQSALPARFRGRHQRPGGCPDSPHQAPPGATVAILAQLDGQRGGNGGATTVPTNAMVANSGVPNTVSNNVVPASSRRPRTPRSSPRCRRRPWPRRKSRTNQVQVASSQTQPAVVSPQRHSHRLPTPPQPVVIQIAGLVKVAPPGSTLGFTDQSAAGRIPYTGSITYPAGSGLQNGAVIGTDPAGTVLTLSPLTAGATTNVTATATTANSPATGTATLSSDGDFFYGNLTAGQQRSADLSYSAECRWRRAFTRRSRTHNSLLSMSSLMHAGAERDSPDDPVPGRQLWRDDAQRRGVAALRGSAGQYAFGSFNATRTRMAPRRTICRRALRSTARARAKARRW